VRLQDFARFRGVRCQAQTHVTQLCHMKRASVRDLHLKTSAIVKEVAQGESFIIEKQGVSVAELRPIRSLPPTRKLPDREDQISILKPSPDSGRILEEDRS
jgi:antitoxin (DNA-binding transcriptional repressor) of toxin-antitoxin stability system